MDVLLSFSFVKGHNLGNIIIWTSLKITQKQGLKITSKVYFEGMVLQKAPTHSFVIENAWIIC